ncbi:SGNH/GDSL hydrolase family protein [Nocardioides mangrovicus]|uniref:SGNH/GDSL hydrolase family protein n=1 Tax=Nocardioides mangrovicus TaxID=2478913 RepID=UPI0013144DDC|nr:SGNH/GDSL hydrolase family protein [Nocardioides mangrovicus]
MRRLLAAALLLVLAGCGGGTTATPARPTTSPTASGSFSLVPAHARYVALGDSYTAAPYVYLTDVAQGCLRSDHNYPALLAKRLGARLTDVSCSAADTTDVEGSQRTFQGTRPPQLAAVGSDTDLVTIGLGGNDFGLFASLVSGCPITGPNGQSFGLQSGTACGRVDVAAALGDLPKIRERLVSVVRAVQAKAPNATVVLVGYPRIASTGAQCRSLLPISQTDAVAADRVTKALSTAMAAAARQTGAGFVNMYAASAGHDVCAGKRAWVNGIHTDTDRAAPLHPFLAEQRAVADRVAAALAG